MRVTPAGQRLTPFAVSEAGSTCRRGPAGGVEVENDRLKAALRNAIDGAIKDQQADGKAEDALHAPVEALREAARGLKKAIDTYRELRGRKSSSERPAEDVRKHVEALDEIAAGKEKSQAKA